MPGADNPFSRMIEVLQQQARKTSGPAWGWGEVSGTAPLRVLYQGVQLAADQLADADKWAAALTIGDKVAVLPNREDGQFAIIRPGETDCAPADHDHDEAYAAIGHDHDEAYAALGHDHDSDYLGKADKAADADKLDGNDSSAFAAAIHAHGGLSGDGKIGTTAGLTLRTGAGGAIIADCPHNIGQPYISLLADDPADIWPGTTWDTLAPGTTIVAGAEGSDFIPGDLTKGEGGAAAHEHTINGQARIWLSTVAHKVYLKRVDAAAYNATHEFSVSGDAGNTASHSYAVEVVGTASSASNMPPWMAFYVWVRTA